MLEVGHTATRLSCFAPVSRCCDGSARAGFETSKLPGSGVLATRYPDLSKPRVRAQAVPRPLPCSYGARRPWCARLGKASSRSEHVAKIYVLTGSRAGPTPAGMEFNRPRTKSYSVAALSGSTIRGFARCVTWILSGGPDRHRSALLLGPEPATLRRHVSGKWVPAGPRLRQQFTFRNPTFDQPRYSRCVTWILSGGPDRHRSALLLGPEPATLRRHVSGLWPPGSPAPTAAVHIPGCLPFREV